ncbi:MAG: hypothetical protein AVDCRST_MAG40-3430 [uncultured Gemmatimonadaceae bacterium]|uniref:Uncharacterized protein n=1 Tax=uncultured Gemmatimonadaceae bacterium TaxID=246130 RepID=A0A6J4MI89_9BACT|nr:MAG: hypothetical protein AVDCRST_MAG40-3430 [uncultured Gemmatimonadaceae bacterium]
MNLDSLIRTYLSRPSYQRLFMAFTVGLFLSCAARVSEAQSGAAAARTAGSPVGNMTIAPAAARR